MVWSFATVGARCVAGAQGVAYSAVAIAREYRCLACKARLAFDLQVSSARNLEQETHGCFSGAQVQLRPPQRYYRLEPAEATIPNLKSRANRLLLGCKAPWFARRRMDSRWLRCGQPWSQRAQELKVEF